MNKQVGLLKQDTVSISQSHFLVLADRLPAYIADIINHNIVRLATESFGSSKNYESHLQICCINLFSAERGSYKTNNFSFQVEELRHCLCE